MEKVEELENVYFDHAVANGDLRIPSAHALINGVPVPHPPGPVTTTRPSCFDVIPRHMSHFPVTNLPSPARAPSYWGRDRSRSPVRGKESMPPCPYEDATTESESIDEYWLESARRQEECVGPSSAPEYISSACVFIEICN